MSIATEEQITEIREKLLKELEQANVIKVIAEYNGYDDSGNVDEIKYVKEKGTTIILPNGESSLKDFIWDFISSLHPGCEIDAGAEGIFEWEMNTDKISIKHEQRHISTESFEHSDL